MFDFRSKNDLLLLKRSLSLDRIRGGRDSYLGYRSRCWISRLLLSILLFLYEKERGRLRGTQSTKETLQAPGWVANISNTCYFCIIYKVTWGQNKRFFLISLHVYWKYKAIKPMIIQRKNFVLYIICAYKYFVLKASF